MIAAAGFSVTVARMRSFVIGGAGFIGSHLVDRLVSRGPVTVFDNLSVGRKAFIAEHLEPRSGPARVSLVEADVLDLDRLREAMIGHDTVFHLAANPEARWGLSRTRLDLEQGTIATYNVLEAMRLTGAKTMVLASSGTVYGETDQAVREGDLGELPISLYGASKMAAEALTSAFVSCFGLRARIFRFGNVVGARGTHGAALDFLRQLGAPENAERKARGEPVALEVLGDGKQAKPYLHVSDCAEGMLFGLDRTDPEAPLAIFNLAPPDTTSVKRIAELCVARSPHPDAAIRYKGGDRGWPGDIPRSRMDASKIRALGFRFRFTSDEAVDAAVRELAGELSAQSAG